MNLPEFKYHPDPIKTGSVVKSDTECECCGEVKGYIYTGPILSEEELDDCICPWCIADGRAHEEFDAEFTDFDCIGDYGSWDNVPEHVKEVIAFKTPGFSGWQQERWWTHCGDAAIFLGAAGNAEIKEFGSMLINQLKQESGYSDEQWESYLSALSKDGSPTAYVFKCSKCGELGGYSDCD
ncbi:CbrC family protein [Microbulbifer variabilis]|uniref:CbrC family protein n=1 Tax=Microbulbifer variabilis TaxID=266805 RepID=A0ABY4V695_9GAMM|nr:CbrC family protein [Microbulbifer variabilis]USD19796.1 CbrC family protein [Microbulbifer variabilis]